MAVDVMPRQLTFRLNPDDEATLDNFYTDSAQSRNAALIEYLRQAVQRFVRGRALAGSGTVLQDFIWLYGSNGAGCSHLLQALCHEMDRLGGESVNLHPFYLDFSVQQGLTPEVLQGLESVSMLCLDSVEVLRGDAEWERALFNLYNRMAELQTPLIIASKCSPKYLQFDLQDLNSRMQSAAVFQLQSLDDEQKAAALKLRAQRRGFELSDELAAYLVSHNERSMNSLFDVLRKLDQHSLETRRKVTLPLLKSMMGW